MKKPIHINTLKVLNNLKKELGIKTDKDLAATLEVSYARLQLWKSRNTLPCKSIIPFCLSENIDLNHIFSEASRAPTPCSTATLDISRPDLEIPETLKIPSNRASICLYSSCVRSPIGYIPRFDLHSNQVVDTMNINLIWLQHVLNIDPDDVAIVRIVGNNMSPWVTDGDLVIIDMSLTTIITDAPYIMRYGKMLVAKRLVLDGDGIIAKSDSPYCEPESFTADTCPQIIGRIIRRVVR